MKQTLAVCVLLFLLSLSAAMAHRHKAFPDDLAQDLNASVPEKAVEVKYPTNAVKVGSPV